MKLDIKLIITVAGILATIAGTWKVNDYRIGQNTAYANENAKEIAILKDKVDSAILEGQKLSSVRDKEVAELKIHAEYTRQSVDLILQELRRKEV